MGGEEEILLSFSADRDEKLMSIVMQRQKDEEPIRYRFGKKSPLQPLFLDYCVRMGLVMEEVRFIFDGQRIKGKQCPHDLDMDNEAVIDVFSDQIGGAHLPLSA